jgi:hypothetical protein
MMMPSTMMNKFYDLNSIISIFTIEILTGIDRKNGSKKWPNLPRLFPAPQLITVTNS